MPRLDLSRLNLPAHHLKTLQALLAEHVPDAEVWAYGSRVTGGAHDGSDLDLVLRDPADLSSVPEGWLDLKEGLAASSLPMLVDVHVWPHLPEDFRRNIEAVYVVVQAGDDWDGWQTAPLEECLDALIDYRGKSPTKSVTGIPVLSAKVVKTTGLVRPIVQTISPDYYKTWMTRGIPQLGDVVMTTEAPLGEVIQLDCVTSKFALGQRIVCMRGKEGKLDNTFLRYLLTSPKQQELLASYATGTTVFGISQKALRSIPISFPQIGEQQRIGTCLAALDDKIELNRQMNETLEAMAQAIFQDWFVDFGPTRRKQAGETDPVAIMGDLSDDPAEATKLAGLFPDALGDDDLPKGWRMGQMDQLIEFNPRESLRKGALAPYSDMSSLPVSGSSAETPILREFGSGMKFKNGDALLARITPCLENGKAALVDFLPDDNPIGWGSTEFIVMRARSPIPAPFSYLLTRWPEFRAAAIQSMTGTSGRQRASAEALARFPFVSGSDALWSEFGRAITPMFAKITQVGSESRTLAETRDYLLPRLMSGEVQVQAA
jgi:type I restriction enzyme S subunit